MGLSVDRIWARRPAAPRRIAGVRWRLSVNSLLSSLPSAANRHSRRQSVFPRLSAEEGSPSSTGVRCAEGPCARYNVSCATKLALLFHVPSSGRCRPDSPFSLIRDCRLRQQRIDCVRQRHGLPPPRLSALSCPSVRYPNNWGGKDGLGLRGHASHSVLPRYVFADIFSVVLVGTWQQQTTTGQTWRGCQTGAWRGHGCDADIQLIIATTRRLDVGKFGRRLNYSIKYFQLQAP